MMILMELETNKKPGPLAFVWPFFQTTRSHPSPQSVIVPTTYPFLEICKFSSLSLFRIPPSAHLRNLKSLVLMVGLCDIDVPTDRPVYPHINEVYASKSGDELEVPKCRSVRLHHARTYDCEYERAEIPLCPCFLLYRKPSAHDMVPDPKLVIYPSKDGKGDGEEHWRARTIDVKVKITYPDFDLYPAVYPFVCLYPVHGNLNSLKIWSVLLGDEAPKCKQSVFHLVQ